MLVSESLPPPEVVAQRIADARRERELLRRLHRLSIDARSAAKLRKDSLSDSCRGRTYPVAKSKLSQCIVIARRRFLRRLQDGPVTFTASIRRIKWPAGVDGRTFGPMVRTLHRDGIIRPVDFAPSSNTDCHSRLWELSNDRQEVARG